jgi:aspartate/tyrosine/aromatic aminotransferase
MLADLAQAKAGDLILLHACCHNPTGADLALDDWREIAEICQRTGAIPFVDMAYLGFAESLEEDAAGTRLLTATPAGGLHRRQLFQEFRALPGTGGRRPDRHRRRRTAAAAAGTLAEFNRQNYTFPPDHGARVVETILNDAVLREEWRDELRAMRLTMLGTGRLWPTRFGPRPGRTGSAISGRTGACSP